MKFREFLDKIDPEIGAAYTDERDYVTDIILDMKQRGIHYGAAQGGPGRQNSAPTSNAHGCR
jgi:hypothetical protein